MRGLMKLAEGARFDCVGSTQEFTCYMAGFAYPPAITPAVGRPARCTVTLPGDTGSVGDVAPHRKQASLRIWGGHIPYPRFTGPDHAAMHPLRLGTPITSRCTRSEEVQCLQIGRTASHNKHNRGQLLPTDPNRPPRTQPHGLETRGNATQRRLKRRLTTEKHTPATTPLTAALISCMDTATPPEEPTEALELGRFSSDCIDIALSSTSPCEALKESAKTLLSSRLPIERKGTPRLPALPSEPNDDTAETEPPIDFTSLHKSQELKSSEDPEFTFPRK